MATQVNLFPSGGFVVHGITGTFSGRASAYFNASGVMDDADQRLPGGSTRTIRRNTPLWRQVEAAGLRAKKLDDEARSYRAATPVSKLPAGAQRVHLGSPKTILAPRGSLDKESLSLAVVERLRSAYEHWTSPAYADSLSGPDAMAAILEQARGELQIALKAFEMQPNE